LAHSIIKVPVDIIRSLFLLFETTGNQVMYVNMFNGTLFLIMLVEEKCVTCFDIFVKAIR